MASEAEDKDGIVYHDNTFLLGSDKTKTYGLILLKTEFGDYFDPLWANAQFVVTCDGAANLLYEREDKENFLPEVIIGDMDSCTRSVSDFYRDKNVRIEVVINQDKTDLMKAIDYILAKPERPEVIVVYGGFTGRFDHLIGNINALYMYSGAGRIVLLQEGKLVELLTPGKHSITCHQKEKSVACGLMPFGGPAHVTSSGLRWNLHGQEMMFGGLVSTSNITEAKVITVNTTGSLLWCTAFGGAKKRPRTTT